MRDVTCPRGRRIDSTPMGGPGVLCTVIEADNERDPAGVSGHVDPVLALARDASSVVAYCTGRGIPGDGERTAAHGHAAGETTCFTDCPVFRAEHERQQRSRRTGIDARLEADGVTAPYRRRPRAPSWEELLAGGMREA